MDFFQIKTKEVKGTLEVYPDFIVGRSKDLMIRGQAFYAIWDEKKGLWSTDEFDVRRLVDEEVLDHVEKLKEEGVICTPKLLRSWETNRWGQFKKYLKNVADDYAPLDMKLTFANTPVKKSDYVSRRLPYALEPGKHDAWDELIGRLYKPEERAKIEWAIGSIVAGDSKKIHKFLVLYGPPGHGKGTVIDILLKLFQGYYTTFEAKELTKNNNSFATEKFRGNPLVAIQHDGDLSRIDDNSKLNSIISHEEMTINEKYKPSYDAKVHAFLFLGTNKPVKISDSKSGLIRRLIDVHPSGNLFEPNHYYSLMAKIDFELGAIAHHCLEVYREMGKNYYSQYKPLEMMYHTDVFFNFVEYYFDVFTEQDGISLRQAYALYKEYCAATGIDKPLMQHQVREQLGSYFEKFEPRAIVDGSPVRSYFSGFTADKFKTPVGKKDKKVFSLVVEETTSIFDSNAAEWPAQYAKEDGTPQKRWSSVKTTLADLDTSKPHFVKVPVTHIVIDFDLKDENGNKSLERNLEAASEWPATYAELSQSGNGVHLHYIYGGPDVSLLDRKYADDIEIKVYTGNSSLRRRLSKCNNVPVATISSGLPFKEKKVLDYDTVKSEKGLRDLIAKNMRKEIHPGTKPSIDFIKKILDDAYKSGIEYDLTDLMPRLITFANNSTNQSIKCLEMVNQMKFKSDEARAPMSEEVRAKVEAEDNRVVFWDIEVYPNLFVICWKFEGPDTSIVAMINPSPAEVESLLKLKLVGFNNRKYDNHILYAALMGYNNQQLFELSQKIIAGAKGAMFGAAYSISYADVLDFSTKKQSLKMFEIELGLHHMELDLPWDKPVPEELWEKVVEYCKNDVVATEATFNARKGDFIARQILADLSGMPVNETTARHAARIIFEGDRSPQRSFNCPDLSKEFPGYKYEFGKSSYRGEDPKEGGYVYAEPGIYEDVVLLDVASMHPTSIIQLNLFGDYTKNFKELVDARLAIKHASKAIEDGELDLADKHLDSTKDMLKGKLGPYLGYGSSKTEESEGDSLRSQVNLKAISEALKIVINSVYGLTSAKFDNPFRDIRNKDNVVAKRGALFMIDLKHMVQEAGFSVAHIKTDSIKIPGAPDWLIDQIIAFGKEYGYDFEHEATYEKMCLVNHAVFVAKVAAKPLDGKPSYWKTVGAQFQEPYVKKTLFTGEEVNFNDMCVTKQVMNGGVMYIDFEGVKPMALVDHTKMQHIGKTGRFVPVKEGFGGGVLYRVKDGKAYAVTGTKDRLFIEASMAKDLPDAGIDVEYFENLADEAVAAIEKFGSFEEFVS